MEFRLLQAFAEVVRQGNFSKAAKTLFVTQSTVSKMVKQLEDELGLALLERLGHRSAPTSAGEIVYRRALAILAERKDLMAELDELKGLQRGVLRLGLPIIGTSPLFTSVFANYRSQYPNVAIHFVEHGSKKLEELVLAGELELGASLLPVSDQFEWQNVRCEPVSALIHADHPLAARDTLALKELKDVDFLLFGQDFALNPIIIESCQRYGFTPKVAVCSSQIDVITALVAAQMGVGFLPRIVADHHRVPQVRCIEITDSSLTWDLALIWRRGAYLSHAAKAWLDLCRASSLMKPAC